MKKWLQYYYIALLTVLLIVPMLACALLAGLSSRGYAGAGGGAAGLDVMSQQGGEGAAADASDEEKSFAAEGLLMRLLGLDPETQSSEMRSLAAFPKLSRQDPSDIPPEAAAAEAAAGIKRVTVSEYPSVFEEWLNDHLPLRSQLVTLNGLIDYRVLKTSSSKSVIIGKDGWLFYKGAQVNDEDPVSDYNGANLFTDEELLTIRANMTAARDELAAQGREFIIFIAPNKERIYREHMPAAYGEAAEYGRMRQVVDYLQETTDLTVVCPYDALMEYKESHETPIYFKYDTHWNYLGAYIGARELNFSFGYYLPGPDDIVREPAEPTSGDLARLIHLDRYLKEDAFWVTEYTNYAIRDEVNALGNEFRFHNMYESGDKRKLFIVGDSFSAMMAKFACCQFDDAYVNFYYNYNYMMLLQEDPDVVVYETVERYLNNMLDFSIRNGIGKN